MNSFEIECKRIIELEGYEVIRGGWPDFLVVDKLGRIKLLLEVKSALDRPSPAQERLASLFRRHGIDARIVWGSEMPDLIKELRASAKEHKAVLRRTRRAINLLSRKTG